MFLCARQATNLQIPKCRSCQGPDGADPTAASAGCCLISTSFCLQKCKKKNRLSSTTQEDNDEHNHTTCKLVHAMSGFELGRFGDFFFNLATADSFNMVCVRKCEKKAKVVGVCAALDRDNLQGLCLCSRTHFSLAITAVLSAICLSKTLTSLDKRSMESLSLCNMNEFRR